MTKCTCDFPDQAEDCIKMNLECIINRNNSAKFSSSRRTSQDVQDVKWLLDEVKRLREALEWIADEANTGESRDAWLMAEHAKEVLGGE